MRTPSLPVVLLAWLVAQPVSAEVKPLKEWRQMRSANFYLMGDVGEGDLRRVAGRLEQFRAAVGVILPRAPMTAATPTTVMVFRSHKSYEPFKPIYNGKPAEHIAGFFLPGEATNFITLTIQNRGQDDDARFGVIYHELVHLMVNNTLRGVPAWFNEGLAEYYRHQEGGTISCGARPADDRVRVAYRPGPPGASLGEVVAVEFMPAASVPQ